LAIVRHRWITGSRPTQTETGRSVPLVLVEKLLGALTVMTLLAAPVTGQVTLLGLVADTTGRVLPNVRVHLDSASFVTTSASGRFFISGVATGSHVLRLERIGVQPRFLRLDVAEDLGDTLDLGQVTLEVLATTLEEIVVSARRYGMDIPGERELQQLQRAGFGHLLTAEEIARMKPGTVEDVVRRMPGVNVGGSLISFWGGGQISCPRGAAFVVDGVRSYTLAFINDPERQIKAMWSYRGANERCGVIVVETNGVDVGDGSAGDVGVRWVGTTRNGTTSIERLGVSLSLPVNRLFDFYPAFEARIGRRKGWNLQLAMKYHVSPSIPIYGGAGLSLGKDAQAGAFTGADLRGAPLVLAGFALPVGRFRAVGEFQFQDFFDPNFQRASFLFGLGYYFGS
jgi:hypothetical protein